MSQVMDAPISDRQKLREIEGLFEMMYGGRPNDHEKASNQLGGFMNDVNFIPHAQFILDNSESTFALMAASQAFLKLITNFWNGFSLHQTLELRNYIMNYLAVRGKKIKPMVVRSLVLIPCRIAKLGWLEKSFQHRTITSEVTKFLQHTVRHCIIGLRLLCELINEMNTLLKGKTMTEHRKVAVSFRDTSLQHIFQISLTSLKQLLRKQVQFSDGLEENQLTIATLDLAIACLGFDFIGTNPDESSSDCGSLQIPASWRPMLENPETLNLFFTAFKQNRHPDKCLEVLVKLASCRRSLFSNEDTRARYLKIMCENTLDILQNHREYFNNPAIYLQFCRLLVSMKSNYQLASLARVECYPKWIEYVAQFTVESFESWEWAANSIYYLVALWARLTLSIPYMRGSLPTFLDGFIPQVASSFIGTRLEAVSKAIDLDCLDDLFDPTDLEDQLRHLPTMCRYQYGKTFDIIRSRIDPLVNSYKLCINAIQTNTLNPQIAKQLRVTEGQLSWLIYTIGSIISGNALPANAREKHRAIDAQLCARVFQLVHLIDFRLSNQNERIPCLDHLDLSILYFFRQFNRNHIGNDDRGPPNGPPPMIFTLLAEYLGPTDQRGVLGAIIKKIVTNLKMWSTNHVVVEKSLNLFRDFALHFSSFKLLVDLPTIREILSNHTGDHFPFLFHPSNSRLRTRFYAILGRFVFAEPNVDFFEQFMQPFDQTFQWISNEQDFNSEHVKARAIGICRDLRGIVQSSSNRRTYTQFFDWFYPGNYNIYLRLFESYWDVPEVAIPMLRFMGEFVDTKTQRILFPNSSPNGIHLFKAASKVIQTYGKRLLHCAPVEYSELYKKKYKGISIAMQILSRSLGGQYLNFGVFEFYNDDTLQLAVDVVIALFSSIELTELLAYTKISKIYYHLLEVLFRHHLPLIISNKNVPYFPSIMTSLLDGIQNFDGTQSTLAACVVDHIATYQFNMTKKRSLKRAISPALEQLEKLLSVKELRDIQSSILSTLLTTLIFDKVGHQWSLTRPLLPLIFLNRDGFSGYARQLASTQPQEVHQRLNQCFEQLLNGVNPSLDSKNRERFSQNLILFKRNLSTFCVRPPK